VRLVLDPQQGAWGCVRGAGSRPAACPGQRVEAPALGADASTEPGSAANCRVVVLLPRGWLARRVIRPRHESYRTSTHLVEEACLLEIRVTQPALARQAKGRAWEDGPEALSRSPM